MDILNMIFTGLFTIEMVLKIIAFKPKVTLSPRPTPEGEFLGGGAHSRALRRQQPGSKETRE
jgi:hypothetical protein